MVMHRMFVLAVIPLLLFCAPSFAKAQTSQRGYDETAWKEMRAAKRDQVRGICGTWFAYWRSGAVGKTYVDLAEVYANIDVSMCSNAVKEHVKNAERINTEIGETFALGMPDIKHVLLVTPGGGGGSVEVESSITSQRASRIMELMKELAQSEKKLIAERGLGD